jgi:hypothetical protein
MAGKHHFPCALKNNGFLAACEFRYEVLAWKLEGEECLPKAARETEEQRRARWDRDVRSFLERQYPQAPNYSASLLIRDTFIGFQGLLYQRDN